MTSSGEVEILLVEDTLADAELAIRALKKRNLANKLVWVKDGAEAIDFLFGQGNHADGSIKNAPKLVMLDLRLPKVDGIEVLKRIKSDERTKGIPVVVVTSSSEERDIVESYQFGVNSYITKPINFEDFAKTISDLGFYWMILNRLP
ncbi:MAG: response regulator [Deltaproteobacteria bacterium]|nr:response regulator [Deltaproteobacteria bacterium]